MKMVRSRLGWMALAVLAAAGFGIYVLAPGGMVAVLPYVLLVACPVSMLLMMRFMHGGQGTPHEDEANLAAGARLARLKSQHAVLDEEIAALERDEVRPSPEDEKATRT
ncbi:MAG: DUF2933 domain-containing protein [Actinomycetota bacterium]|nr:DUF2933 domain-containing protein [Actinomycetota bacterium]